MRRMILLKAMSGFGGALSIWMELHFFYTLLTLLSMTLQNQRINYLDTMHLPMDVWLVVMGVSLHYLIESNYPILLKRGDNENGTYDSQLEGRSGFST